MVSIYDVVDLTTLVRWAQQIIPGLAEDVRDYIQLIEYKRQELQWRVPFMTLSDLETLIKEKNALRLKYLITTGEHQPELSIEDITTINLSVTWMSRYPPNCYASICIFSKYDTVAYAPPFYDCWEFTETPYLRDFSIADGRTPLSVFASEEVWGITNQGGAMTTQGILDRFFDEPLQRIFSECHIPINMYIEAKKHNGQSEIDLLSTPGDTVIYFPENSDS